MELQSPQRFILPITSRPKRPEFVRLAARCTTSRVLAYKNSPVSAGLGKNPVRFANLVSFRFSKLARGSSCMALLPFVASQSRRLLFFAIDVFNTLVMFRVACVVVALMKLRFKPDPLIAPTHHIDTNEEAEKLLRQLSDESNDIIFVCGSNKSGKTSLVKNALRLKKRGYLFVEVQCVRLPPIDPSSWLPELVTDLLEAVARYYVWLWKEKPLVVLDELHPLLGGEDIRFQTVFTHLKYMAADKLIKLVVVGNGGELEWYTESRNFKTIRLESLEHHKLTEHLIRKYPQLENRRDEVYQAASWFGSNIPTCEWWTRMLLEKPFEKVRKEYLLMAPASDFMGSSLISSSTGDWGPKLLEAMADNNGKLDLKQVQMIVPRLLLARVCGSNVFVVDEQSQLRFASETHANFAAMILKRDFVSAFLNGTKLTNLQHFISLRTADFGTTPVSKPDLTVWQIY